MVNKPTSGELIFFHLQSSRFSEVAFAQLEIRKSHPVDMMARAVVRVTQQRRQRGSGEAEAFLLCCK